MRIPILNIYILREATFETVVKDAALKALAYQKKQACILLEENYRLGQGKPTKKELKLKRRAK